MIIKNKTVGVIHIEGVAVLPDQSIEVADKVFEQNEVIKGLVANNCLEASAGELEVEHENINELRKEYESLRDSGASVARLRNFAKRNSIELSSAKTSEEICAVIEGYIFSKEISK